MCKESVPAIREVGSTAHALQADGVDAVWTQDNGTVTVGVVIADDVRAKQVDLEVHPRRMKLAIQGQTALEGGFTANEHVDPNGSFFELETNEKGRMCVVTLQKKEIGHDSWDSFFADESIDDSVTCKVLRCVSTSP